MMEKATALTLLRRERQSHEPVLNVGWPVKALPDWRCGGVQLLRVDEVRLVSRRSPLTQPIRQQMLL